MVWGFGKRSAATAELIKLDALPYRIKCHATFIYVSLALLLHLLSSTPHNWKRNVVCDPARIGTELCNERGEGS